MHKHLRHTSPDTHLLSSIIDSPKNIIIFALDRHYCYIAFNTNHKQTMKKIWGVDIEIGLNMLDIIKDTHDRKKAKQNFDRALNGESFTLTENYGEFPNRYFYEDTYSPVFDDTGKVTGLTVFLTDITEKKKAEEELNLCRQQLEDIVKQRTQELEAAKIALEEDVTKRVETEKHLMQILDELNASKLRLQTIIDAEPECVKVLDLDGNLVDMNPAGLKMIEADSLDQVRGQSILPLIVPENQESYQSMLYHVLEGHPEILVFEITGLKGTHRWLETHSVPLYNAQNEITGVLGVTRDITERKLAQDALSRRDAILNAIGLSANLLLKTSSWTEVVNEVLERIGTATQVSRVYLFENHVATDGTLLTSHRFEWVAEGIKPQTYEKDLQDLPWIAGGMGRWIAVMSKNQPIYGLIRTFPESERVILEKHDMKSLLALPIFIDKEWWGFIGLDDCVREREWTGQEISALRVAASTLGFSIKRERSEKAIKESEEKFRTLFEDSRDAIYFSSEDGLLIDFNHSMEKLLSYSRQELLAISTEKLYARKNDRQLFKQMIESQGYVKDYEMSLRKKDGTIIDCLVTSSVRRNSAGNIIGYQGIIRDITTHKRMKNVWISLRHLAKRLNAALSISEIGPIVAEEARNLFNYDAFSLDLVDENAGMLVGIYNEDTFAEGQHPVPVPTASHPLAKMKKDAALQGKPQIINRKRIPKKVSKAMFGSNRLSRSLLYVPIFLKEKVIGVLSVQSYTLNKYNEEDLSLLETFANHASAALARAQQQEALKKALKDARQGERVKTLFLANMSHEIRTPLNSILGFTELIEGLTRDQLGEEEKMFFDIIRASGKRLMHTVHEILDISQIEAGTYKIKIETVDLCELVKDLIQEVSLEAEHKGLKLDFISEVETANIQADRHGISEAIGNILENAIKYTEEGKVSLFLDSNSDQYILKIQDTGIGMSQKYVDRMFDAFSQESEGYTKDFQGIGLGMAIAKHHLDMNHVAIQVDSAKGVGTTFILTFTS